MVGDLTIRDVTREVTLDAEFLGLDETGLQGEPRIGFSGRTRVRRSDFGVGGAPEGGKVVVGDVVDVDVDLEAALEDADAGMSDLVLQMGISIDGYVSGGPRGRHRRRRARAPGRRGQEAGVGHRRRASMRWAGRPTRRWPASGRRRPGRTPSR